MKSGCIENSDWDTFSLETEGTKGLFLKREIYQICSSTQDVCPQTSTLVTDMLSLESSTKRNQYLDRTVNMNVWPSENSVLLWHGQYVFILDRCIIWRLWSLTLVSPDPAGFSVACPSEVLVLAALQDSIHVGSKPMVISAWTMPGIWLHSITLISKSLTYILWFNCHLLVYVGVWGNWLPRNIASVQMYYSVSKRSVSYNMACPHVIDHGFIIYVHFIFSCIKGLPWFINILLLTEKLLSFENKMQTFNGLFFVLFYQGCKCVVKYVLR